ncbi:hypothetical protein [Kitasatospora aureofaciens]|uniref:hypothetical protein n=1 Tax=Kitasatospora aureofaciens TaxID=1894 RepID=UPI00131D33E5|nr:hypothetical protein [Kitasatospora aureofaciens]
MTKVDSGLEPAASVARPISVWRQRNFQAMWSAHTVSQFGTQITFFVIPVLALTNLAPSRSARWPAATSAPSSAHVQRCG